MPLFVTADADNKLDSSDAEFVDVFHTNALVQGKIEQCGHVDFYLNGGVYQPGCLQAGTNHIFQCSQWVIVQSFLKIITQFNVLVIELLTTLLNQFSLSSVSGVGGAKVTFTTFSACAHRQVKSKRWLAKTADRHRPECSSSTQTLLRHTRLDESLRQRERRASTRFQSVRSGTWIRFWRKLTSLAS